GGGGGGCREGFPRKVVAGIGCAGGLPTGRAMAARPFERPVYWQGVELMQSPEPKVELTQTPTGGGQSASSVHSLRQASPPSSMHTSASPQPNPGQTQCRASHPANVQYCWQTAPPLHSPSLVQVGPTP